MTRDCTLSPSRPARGLSFTPTVIEMVGGSIGRASSGVSTSSAHRVSATVALDMPAMATMSPASTPSSIGWRFRPRKASTLVMRPCSMVLPSRDRALMAMPGTALPEWMRPVSRRPRKGSLSIRTFRILNGSLTRAWASGAGTWSTIRSYSGCRLSFGWARSSVAQPERPEA